MVAIRKKNDRVIYVHRCFMTFLATLCVGLAGLTFNLHAQLKVSVRMTAKLELKLEKSSSIHNNFDSSFHNEHITFIQMSPIKVHPKLQQRQSQIQRHRQRPRPGPSQRPVARNMKKCIQKMNLNAYYSMSFYITIFQC